jgi:hypothetical protein
MIDIGSFLINGQLFLLLSLIGCDNLSEQLQSFRSLGLGDLVGGSLEDHEQHVSGVALDEAGVLIVGEPGLAE